MDGCADSANALRPDPGFARIAAAQIISMPRNIVPELQASVHPAVTWASIRRCPSIRVTGSTTIRAMASSCYPFGFRRFGSCSSVVVDLGLILSRTMLPTTCTAIAAATAPVSHPSDLFRGDIDAEAGYGGNRL